MDCLYSSAFLQQKPDVWQFMCYHIYSSSTSKQKHITYHRTCLMFNPRGSGCRPKVSSSCNGLRTTSLTRPCVCPGVDVAEARTRSGADA